MGAVQSSPSTPILDPAQPVHQTTTNEATNAEASTGAVKPSSPIPVHQATPNEATNADASTGAVKPSSPTPVHQTTPDEATDAEASTGAVKPPSSTPFPDSAQPINEAHSKAANADAFIEAGPNVKE